jgi:ATP-dependent exoDNAse (exonuclease V) alpha subunit
MQAVVIAIPILRISITHSARKDGEIMATYHLSSQIIGRSGGKSSVASAAYRSGEKIQDEHIGQTFDYTKKMGVDYKEILAPDRSPAWVQDREKLWNQVEMIERRKDAQLARELNFALPKELNKEQQIELIRNFAKEQFVDKGMVSDLTIHHLAGENPHAHIMLTTREIGPEGFGKKNREWNDRELLKEWRKEWAEQANKALEKVGVLERIDHRSYKNQGSKQIPQIHVGVHANAMEKKGIQTERGDINREIKELNTERDKFNTTKRNLMQEEKQYLAEIKAREKIQDDILFGQPNQKQPSEPTQPQPQQKPLEPVGKEIGNGRNTLSVDEWKREVSQVKSKTEQPQPKFASDYEFKKPKTFQEIKTDFDQARTELGRQRETIDRIDSQLRSETDKLEKFKNYEERIGDVEERLGQLSRFKPWHWNEIKALEQSKANLTKNKQTDSWETKREHIVQRITQLRDKKQSEKKKLPNLENRYKEAKGTYDQRPAKIAAIKQQRNLDKSKDLLERYQAGGKLTTQETKLINSFSKELNIKKSP